LSIEKPDKKQYIRSQLLKEQKVSLTAPILVNTKIPEINGHVRFLLQKTPVRLISCYGSPMIKMLALFFTFFSAYSYSLECLDTNNSFDIDSHWKAREDIFVGRVISGKFDPKTKERVYDVDIESTFKGNLQDTTKYITYYSYEILLGESYLFMLPGNKRTPSECIRISPFEFSWENRSDLIYSKDVKRILELSRKKP
jgi:hypothetical protein